MSALGAGGGHRQGCTERSAGCSTKRSWEECKTVGQERTCADLVQSHKSAEEDRGRESHMGGAGALPHQGSVPGPARSMDLI